MSTSDLLEDRGGSVAGSVKRAATNGTQFPSFRLASGKVHGQARTRAAFHNQREFCHGSSSDVHTSHIRLWPCA
ncbi:hypothetical protein MPTK1_4g09100 [Marchantia polymorpha subsp. ruderalis]|uniref:Uncharacterized protein n=2 Tax=Marchantia polymorpha TaxID=3197 RepID=A0AAF6B7Z2_MARPO|nr:hypothetical protein MARPO_0112s0011 [Marchantia polymorpha]BBN08126.1 hypothetical protein Mp_4g09100 [Marchantia polymorpha subsp. ruderalis]|eukprot:PTQ31351.1 hypothetical protein MARPO_0112s0011 [Marchantia polymorpha]